MSSGVDVEPMEDDPVTQVEEGKEKSLAFMKRDLFDYRKRMGNKGTFKGWIANSYPENVKIDKRLEKQDSEFQKLWEESTRKLTRKKQLKLKRNQTARISLKESNQNDK